jgi:hypothetical protein
VNSLRAIGRLLLGAARRRHEESTRSLPPWQHYTDFSPNGEYLIGMYRVANGRQVGTKVELFRLPPEHSEIDVRVKIQQARRQAALANESWSNS